ncbi:MAG: hypothetical protein AB8C95_13660 [Phycisphaeraceae bacterium]
MLDRYDQDLLLDYLEDELDADRRAEIDALLADDPQLAGLLVEMAKDRAALRSLPQAEAPAGLVHDTTHAMERQMLLDDSMQDAGPIPLSRGRALAAEPTRSISWGRVVGLTGLAASVALVAAVLVITFDDPLERTANELADNSPTESEEAALDSLAVGVARSEPGSSELAALDQPNLTNGSPTPDVAATPSDTIANKPNSFDEAIALLDRSRHATPGQPPVAPELELPRETIGDPLARMPAPLPTAAISAIQPQQKLVLFSESPEISLEQLVEFCVANGIPVVQPEQMSFGGNASSRFGSAEQAPSANAQTLASDDEPVAEYALLINETQLNTLVDSLNNDINIDPSRAGKASLISNQAAMLTDLPADTNQLFLHEGEPSALANRNPAEDDQPGIAQQPELVQQRQAIQLRSPDLGSVDANRRNAYNLKAQQQASYGQPDDPLAAVEPLVNSPFGDERGLAKSDAQQPNSAKALAESDLADSEGAGLLEGTSQPDSKQADSGNEFEADEPKQETKKQGLAIDPARGNWLSPHLPMSNTTPLLLSWRERQIDRATKLIPVMIQRAEPDKVNMLRQRQQVEYANRTNDSAADSETKPEELAENIADDQPDTEVKESEPLEEATPAEPAE